MPPVDYELVEMVAVIVHRVVPEVALRDAINVLERAAEAGVSGEDLLRQAVSLVRDR